jgi:hypothetical protein
MQTVAWNSGNCNNRASVSFLLYNTLSTQLILSLQMLTVLSSGSLIVWDIGVPCFEHTQARNYSK